MARTFGQILQILNFFNLIFLVSVCCVAHWTKPDMQSRLLEDDELDGQVTLHLYHSLEPSDSPPLYHKRGIITVNSARNEATYTEETPLSVTDVEKLKILAASDDIYRIKVLYKPDQLDKDAVFSYTKACSIYESGSTFSIAVTLDQSNIPVGVSISAVSPYCSEKSVSNFKLHSTVNTSVTIVPLVNGPSPDTLTYIQRLEQEKAEKARGEQGDNRSFFAKYWMYIVPFVIFLVISGASGPEAQGAGR